MFKTWVVGLRFLRVQEEAYFVWVQTSFLSGGRGWCVGGGWVENGKLSRSENSC